MKQILKILWSIIKGDKYIFYSKNSHRLLYNTTDKEAIDAIQKVRAEAVSLYYKKHIV